ncbi:MAG: SDR family NAD(P)-dependent oxidoreductase, partial [Candidatus Omnitrophica bacterium]|nr:SDR family NAD(P)-dependent oxidoreductase [Candidatus Omnitrophota bacterium]
MDKTDYLEKFSLKNKVAYVTGAAGLLGSEISSALAQAGAETIILDVEDKKGKELESKLKKAGLKAHYEQFDVADIQNIDDNCQNLLKKYKSMDIWVNCA